MLCLQLLPVFMLMQINVNREKVKSNHDFTQQCKERVTHLAATHQRFTQPKTLEACYQSVDTPRKEDQSKMARLHQHPRHYTARRIKFEETTIEGERKSRLEGELSEHNNAGGCSQLVEQQFDTHGGATATRDVKLAEHSLRLDMMDYKDTNGVLLWKITDIRRRRRDAVSGKTPSIYSQPFYTSPRGYKMCARMYLNGDGMGRGTHLSLFFVIMRGEYDCLLSWPFTRKFTLRVIDQGGINHISDTFRPDPTSSSVQRTGHDMNVVSGCPLFVSLETLDTGSYIRNDAMIIQVVVDCTEPDAIVDHRDAIRL